MIGRATGGFTELTTDEGNYNMATFSIKIKVVCLEKYYGSDCSILRFCEPQDDDTIGHYTCDSNNNLVCLNGYQNTESNCTETVPMITVATTDPPTETTVATTYPPIETTVATTDPPIKTTVATTDPLTETTAATTANNQTTQTHEIVTTINIDDDSMVTNPCNNVTTSAPASVGMEIAAGTVVGGLVVILLIVIVIVNIAVFVFKQRRQGRDGKVNHKYCYNNIYYSYVLYVLFMLLGWNYTVLHYVTVTLLQNKRTLL